MKTLFDKFFTKESQFNYVIAEYQPVKINTLRRDVIVTEYDIDKPASNDEMDIDNIYQQL